MSELFWTQYRNNPQHTGRSPYPSIANPTLNWIVEIEEEGSVTEPLLSPDNKLYIASQDKCYEIDVITGELRREFPTDNLCHAIALDPANHNLYASDEDGSNYAFDLATGRQEWMVHPGAMNYQTVGSDGTLFLVTDNGYLWAVTPAGETVWQREIDGAYDDPMSMLAECHGPAIDKDGKLYLGGRDRHVYSVDSAGNMLWKCAVPDRIETGLSIDSHGNIYGLTSNGTLFSITPTGELLWTFETIQDEIYKGTSAVLAAASLAIDTADTCYFTTWTGGILYAIDKAGQEKWRFKADGRIYVSPTITTDGIIYVVSTTRKLYALKPDGTLLWTFDTDDELAASPIIGPDSTIYTASTHGRVYSIGSASV